MQRFAVIGLGRFGSRLARNLASLGGEVIAVDRDRDLVEAIRDRVTLAIALDATDEQALVRQGIDKVEVAVVGIGHDFESSALATVTLKQLGVPRVISRADTPASARILARIGADEVVSPEDEAADRWSQRLMSPHFLQQVELDAGHSLVEVATPGPWVGKTLIDLKLRREAGIHVVAVRRLVPSKPGAPDQRAIQIPDPRQELGAQDILVLMGPDEQLAELPRPADA